MVRREGELSTFRIDNGWPHQVALPEAVSLGKTNDVVRDFCVAKKNRLCGSTSSGGFLALRM
jgi:hypothetical protein